MNGAMTAAMPGAQARDEAARHGGVPGSSVNDAASERFESEAASDRIANAGPADGPSTSTGVSDEPSADRLAAAAAAATAAPVPPPSMPADPAGAALEQLRRNRASIVRSLATARPARRRGGDAGGLPDHWSLLRTAGAGAVAATARHHPFVAAGAAVVAGVMLARLLGRRSIVRPMLVIPLLSRIVAPMVMRMVSDAVLRRVRGTAGRGPSGGMPHPP